MDQTVKTLTNAQVSQSQVWARNLRWVQDLRYNLEVSNGTSLFDALSALSVTSLSKATLLHGYRLEVPNCLVDIAIDLFDTVYASKSKINHLMQKVVSFNFNQVQVLP